MPRRALALAAAMSAVPVAFAFGAVAPSEFPPLTARDLLAICAAGRDDPMMTAAVNYCDGFVEGAIDVEEAHESRRRTRKLFCIPEPRPTPNEALAPAKSSAAARSSESSPTRPLSRASSVLCCWSK